tara:strand:+ start:169 stop:315 length:147 start_codon:yes stop_codon:yes gene_type:complete
MNTFIDWHKKVLGWWKKKLNISNYGIAWIAFIKGLVIGLLIYHFFIKT